MPTSNNGSSSSSTPRDEQANIDPLTILFGLLMLLLVFGLLTGPCAYYQCQQHINRTVLRNERLRRELRALDFSRERADTENEHKNENKSDENANASINLERPRRIVSIDPPLSQQAALFIRRNENCCICLTNLMVGIEGHQLIELRDCGHVFHFECISRWLDHKSRCPLCNREVGGPAPEGSEQEEE